MFHKRKKIKYKQGDAFYNYFNGKYHGILCQMKINFDNFKATFQLFDDKEIQNLYQLTQDLSEIWKRNQITYKSMSILFIE